MKNSFRVQNIAWLLLPFLFTAAIARGQESGTEESKGPIKVFILSGQSNMVGAGKVTGGGGRWGDEFIDPVVSVYDGSYDAAKDYD